MLDKKMVPRIYLDKHNRRAKIFDAVPLTLENLERILDFSREKDMGKVICSCRQAALENFLAVGFELEGTIPGYFRGEDAYCVSYFLNKERASSEHEKEQDAIIDQCENLDIDSLSMPMGKDPYQVRVANEGDVAKMISLFKKVFSTYPSNVFDDGYLKKTMQDNVLYKLALSEGEIVAIASAEIDKKHLNAEITDCATLSEYRGKGLSSRLIRSLEHDLKEMGLITLYSLSRAINPGINIVFKKNGYLYSGRLKKNCNMCGSFEDMNIWVKTISG